MNSLRFLSSLPDASGKSLLRKLGFGYMLSPMVAYTSRIIMQAIPARVITIKILSTEDSDFLGFDVTKTYLIPLESWCQAQQPPAKRIEIRPAVVK